MTQLELPLEVAARFAVSHPWRIAVITRYGTQFATRRGGWCLHENDAGVLRLETREHVVELLKRRPGVPWRLGEGLA